MNSKLTLTIEHDIIENAKSYAKSKGRSLSDLIENYLKLVVTHPSTELELSPKIKKLKGAIKLSSSFDYKKELNKSLNKKYSI